MLPTPGIKPIQLLTNTKMKMVATHGKKESARSPATLSARPKSASTTISMKFCNPLGMRLIREVASAATPITIKSTMMVVMRELVNQAGPLEKIGIPDNSTWGGGTGIKKPIMKRIIAAAHSPARRGLLLIHALNLFQLSVKDFWMDSMLVIPFGNMGSAQATAKYF